MKITFLGTGNAQATKIYNTCFVMDTPQERILVDAGGGNAVLSILEEKKISLTSLDRLFITHAHIDHLLGCIWIIRRMAEEMRKGKRDKVFLVHAHEELIDLIIPFMKATLTSRVCSLFGDKILFIANRSGEGIETADGILTPFDIRSTKLRQDGFVLESGGIRLVNAGDEPLDESNFHLARNCDWLTHEAFCLYGDRDIYHPYEKNHSTVREASALASSLEVKNLILYHTEDKSGIGSRKERYSAEARQYYSGNVFVPDDGEEIIL